MGDRSDVYSFLNYLIARVEEEQRAEAFRVYVTDSLFFLQHITANSEDDENRCVFNIKYSELVGLEQQEEKEEVDTEAVIERMVEKSQKM